MGNAQLKRKSDRKGQQDEMKDSEGANDLRSAGEVNILCRNQSLESAQCEGVLTTRLNNAAGLNE